MCTLLEVLKCIVDYYLNKEELNTLDEEFKIERHIIDMVHKNRNTYGRRKKKKELDKLSHQVSQTRISRIMKENALVSNYTVAQYKVVAMGVMNQIFQVYLIETLII